MRTFLFPRWDMLGSRKVYALKAPALKKWDYYWWLIHLSIKKNGGALLLLVVDVSQFSKNLYTFYQKSTFKRNDTSTSTSPLPPFRIFWAIQHNNKTMSLVVEKTKKRCHFNHSHRINGTSIFTIHSPFTMGLVY